MRDTVLTKNCEACGQPKPLTLMHFKVDKSSPDGLGKVCFDCRADRYDKRCRTRDQQIARFRHSAAWSRCLEYWNSACAICGRQPGGGFILAVDHWQPLRDDEPPILAVTNALPLCHARKGVSGGCNNLKRNHNPEAWVLSFLGAEQGADKLLEIADYFIWASQQEN